MIRVFLGVFALIFATPIFIYSIVVTDAPGAAYILGALGVAFGVALMWPERWTR